MPFLIKKILAPVVQKVDNAIHRINHYPLDSAIGFPMDSARIGGSQWGVGFYGYRLKFWLVYGLSVNFFQLRLTSFVSQS